MKRIADKEKIDADNRVEARGAKIKELEKALKDTTKSLEDAFKATKVVEKERDAAIELAKTQAADIKARDRELIKKVRFLSASLIRKSILFVFCYLV